MMDCKLSRPTVSFFSAAFASLWSTRKTIEPNFLSNEGYGVIYFLNCAMFCVSFVCLFVDRFLRGFLKVEPVHQDTGA